MKLAFELPPARRLKINGSDERFAVNRIYCVGRNYAAHAREMGGDERDPPFFFMKPGGSAVDASATIALPYPPMTRNFHHEVELVVAVGKAGANIAAEDALSHVFAYAVGLDMTRRDLQLAAREKGQPWEFGKAFANSAPISALSLASQIGHPQDGRIELAVNGQVRQTGDISMLIWSVAECLSYLSRYDALLPGDLIMTGTPAGVGPVVQGDHMKGRIEGVGEIDVTIC